MLRLCCAELGLALHGHQPIQRQDQKLQRDAETEICKSWTVIIHLNLLKLCLLKYLEMVVTKNFAFICDVLTCVASLLDFPVLCPVLTLTHKIPTCEQIYRMYKLPYKWSLSALLLDRYKYRYRYIVQMASQQNPWFQATCCQIYKTTCDKNL